MDSIARVEPRIWAIVEVNTSRVAVCDPDYRFIRHCLIELNNKFNDSRLTLNPIKYQIVRFDVALSDKEVFSRVK